MASDSSLRRRLLRDIAELKSEPYPFIYLHVQDSLEEACLILTPEGSRPLHLKMTLLNYPLVPPTITIQTRIRHPNVYGDYICASILNTEKGYTPAYTLKSIAIQLLSFFSSDSLEQDHGGIVDLTRYRACNSAKNQPYRGYYNSHTFHCNGCGFDSLARTSRRSHNHQSTRCAPTDQPWLAPVRPPTGTQSRLVKGHRFVEADERRRLNGNVHIARSGISLMDLPNEVLLIILSSLSFYDVIAIANAFPKARKLIDFYDLKHVREIQCFCLKENFKDSKLGVGVAVGDHGREK
ncbi:MAG: hypothetical protein Q9183_006058 [Haloplaca sp. 2 TL-2023]